VKTEQNQMRDVLHVAHDMAREMPRDTLGMVGYGFMELRDGDGQLKMLVPFANIITDVGDMYYAQKGIVGIAPAAPAAPTAITGMQIGSGTTAVAKAGAGGAMVTLLVGIAGFDTTYPSVSNLGAGLGVNMVYKTTFSAGSGTGTVGEATITNGTATVASTVANTISRVLVSPTIVKAAADSLAITWNHKNLGV